MIFDEIVHASELSVSQDAGDGIEPALVQDAACAGAADIIPREGRELCHDHIALLRFKAMQARQGGGGFELGVNLDVRGGQSTGRSFTVEQRFEQHLHGEIFEESVIGGPVGG